MGAVMTEINEENEIEVSGESKFTKVALMVVTVLLIFVGPTYVPYLMSDVAKINYDASIGVGFVLFIVGIAMMVLLIRKKIVS